MDPKSYVQEFEAALAELRSHEYDTSNLYLSDFLRASDVRDYCQHRLEEAKKVASGAHSAPHSPGVAALQIIDIIREVAQDLERRMEGYLDQRRSVERQSLNRVAETIVRLNELSL